MLARRSKLENRSYNLLSAVLLGFVKSVDLLECVALNTSSQKLRKLDGILEIGAFSSALGRLYRLISI